MYGHQFNELRDMLAGVESVKLGRGQVAGEFYEDFLKHCKNLKFLSISNIYGNSLIGTGNEWLLRQYPSLERIELKEAHIIYNLGFSMEIGPIGMFFELNPNIQTLSISAQLLKHCTNSLNGANIKLDHLIVYCNYPHDIQQVFHLLNELYQHGFYRRLSLDGAFYALEGGSHRLMLVHNLGKISITYIDRFDSNIAWRPLKNLKALNIGYVDSHVDLNTLAKSLINVERIHITKGSFNNVLAFIRHSAKVKQIRIDHFTNGQHFNLDIHELHVLKAERAKLIGAHKTTIFIKDEYYIAMKSKTNRYKFNLISINRKERW